MMRLFVVLYCVLFWSLIIFLFLSGCSASKPDPQVETAVAVSGEFKSVRVSQVDTMATAVSERVTTEATAPAGIFQAVIDVDSLRSFGSVHSITNGVAWVATLNPANGKITAYIMQPGASIKQTVDRQTNQAARQSFQLIESTAKKDSVATSKTSAVQPDRQRTGSLYAFYTWLKVAVVLLSAVVLVAYIRPVWLWVRALFPK